MKIRTLNYVIAVLLLGIFLVSCDQQKISAINADPGSFHNKEVQIAGEVTQSIGALGKGVYLLNDGTGSLWVYSDKLGVPSKGAKVGVKGTVLPTFTFLGTNYATVLRESDRHAASGN
jgi:hypothetical protein